MMGTGEAEGEDRAAKAAEAAISNPLLDDYCLSTANGTPACSECPGSRQPVRPPPASLDGPAGLLYAGLLYALERSARTTHEGLEGLRCHSQRHSHARGVSILGVLINITGGSDMTLFEVDQAARRVQEEVHPDANIIFGSTHDDALAGTIRVSIVAAGIDTLSADASTDAS